MLAHFRFFLFLILAIITMPPMYLVSYIYKPWAVPIRGIWCRVQIFVVGIKFEIENLPKENTGLFIINHRSWLDILILEAVIHKLGNGMDLCWIGHSNLTKNPVLKALFNLYGNVTVERESRSGLVKLLRTVEKPIEDKRPIMIFPEGTRNKKRGIGKFKQGAQIIANKNNLNVQPVVLSSTDYFFDTRTMKIRSGVLKIIFLETVLKEDENWLETIHEKMASEYKKVEFH